MVISTCKHEQFQKNGKTKSGAIRYRCILCGKSWTAFTKAFEGMRVGMELTIQIVSMLCEGVSVRSTSRLTGADKQTVIDVANFVGSRCEAYMQQRLKDLPVFDVQLDEIWQFIYCKRHTAVRQKYVGGCGDSYCYTAIERGSKLLITWHLGRRNDVDTFEFCRKLKEATKGRFHLSTDGWSSYPPCILRHLGGRVDYGVLIKQYREPVKEDRRRYSPPQIIGTRKDMILGNPEWRQVCTSHAERMNGSIRHFCKRMGRLTYCFSKRWGNHQAALGLMFAHYNFCKKHRSLKGRTPAMAQGLEDHVWTSRELIEAVVG
jgi:transposase-like protein/IS1 family transposase